MNVGSLAGVKVIDLTRMLAGPFCTAMLADHGADVIKIEPPQGDMTRGLGPFRDDDDVHDHGGYFASINRNKRSVVLDLKQRDAREILLKLVPLLSQYPSLKMALLTIQGLHRQLK